MLPNVEERALPVLGELTAEDLGLDLEQRGALARARTLELPIWKRTDLGTLDLAALTPVFGITEIEATPEGRLYVADLATALSERPELVRSHFCQAVAADFNTFVAFNAALARDGVVIHVPRNLEVAAPIRVRYRLPAAGTAIFPRTIVVAEANSRVTVIEEFVSDDLDGAGLVVPVAEIFVRDGAAVDFVSLQTLGQGAYQLGAQAAIAGRDTRVNWMSGAVGATVQHVDMDCRLEGNGSTLNWLGFTFGVGNQQLLWAPRVHHIGVSTTATIQWKSAVADSSYVVFDGMINIEHGAQGTNSDLRDHVLHLSPKARSDSIPGLEIDANEVKAGHGSTSGQIDEEQLFYLRSRGFSRQDATRAIVLGFFASIVEQITVEPIKETVLGLIERKI
jgi:Fe-S cluster assembly protein SufD